MSRAQRDGQDLTQSGNEAVPTMKRRKYRDFSDMPDEALRDFVRAWDERVRHGAKRTKAARPLAHGPQGVAAVSDVGRHEEHDARRTGTEREASAE